MTPIRYYTWRGVVFLLYHIPANGEGDLTIYERFKASLLSPEPASPMIDASPTGGVL